LSHLLWIYEASGIILGVAWRQEVQRLLLDSESEVSAAAQKGHALAGFERSIAPPNQRYKACLAAPEFVAVGMCQVAFLSGSVKGGG